MKHLNILVLAFLSFFVALPAVGQNGKIKRGDKMYEMMSYPAAIRKYEKGLKKSSDLRGMERLADAYMNIGNSEKAEEWYAKVVKIKGAAPANMLHYGEALKMNGKYSEARKWFDAYLQSGEMPQLAARMKESCDFALEGMKDSLRYTIKAEPFNTSRSEFGPVLYQNGMIFSGESKGGCTRRLNLRNENFFYDMYYTERSLKKKGYTVKALKGNVNKKYHDGPGVLAPNQDTLYFTRSNYVKDKKARNAKNLSKLKILSAMRDGKKWKVQDMLPFNSDNYSCGHPALSTDGKTMIFASDIPGGFGGTDLYLSRMEGGKWSVPQNLGSAVNTEGEESFPYLHPSGTLFFASTGHPGFGGYDIFYSEGAGNGWSKPVNAGYPLNSAKDDFSMAWIGNRPRGYFASDRDGDDDIYTFTRKMQVRGLMVDSRTGAPLENVAVAVLDANGRESKYITGKDGKFYHYGEWGREYYVTGYKEEYIENRQQYNSADLSPMEDLEFVMKLERDLIYTISGKVTDATTNQPLPGARVRLIANAEKGIQAESDGKYFSKAMEEREYTVIVTNPGYVPQIYEFSTVGLTDPQDFVFNAELVKGNYLLVEGKTLLREGEIPEPGVNIRAVDAVNRAERSATRSRTDGRFWKVLDPSIEQYIIGSKEGFFASHADLPLPDSTRGDTTVQVTLYMVRYEVGALVKTIYYDYNKSDIKKIASRELFEIVYFLQDNPEASIDLSSYTDARGGNKYNEALSQRRSNAAVNYIVSRSIARKRVGAKGFGETNLVNKCKDGVECTEELHSQNRRTEIHVTKLDMSKAILRTDEKTIPGKD